MKKNKKWLLLLIVAFPSLFWLILETSTINSRRLPYYGPKAVTKNSEDTLFHTVPTAYINTNTAKPMFRKEGLIHVVCFVAQQYRDDAYRLTGLWEYLNYKKSKIAPLPVVLITEKDTVELSAGRELSKLNEHENVMFVEMEKNKFRQARAAFFEDKPYYIDYSFFVLIDAGGHVRGFYDARYVSEIKRLLGEYQHLRLKEEKKQMIETNEIKTEH